MWLQAHTKMAEESRNVHVLQLSKKSYEYYAIKDLHHFQLINAAFKTMMQLTFIHFDLATQLFQISQMISK